VRRSREPRTSPRGIPTRKKREAKRKTSLELVERESDPIFPVRPGNGQNWRYPKYAFCKALTSEGYIIYCQNRKQQGRSKYGCYENNSLVWNRLTVFEK
jgi:hypothetical protein